jgi:hypothetical protein
VRPDLDFYLYFSSLCRGRNISPTVSSSSSTMAPYMVLYAVAGSRPSPAAKLHCPHSLQDNPPTLPYREYWSRFERGNKAATASASIQQPASNQQPTRSKPAGRPSSHPVGTPARRAVLGLPYQKYISSGTASDSLGYRLVYVQDSVTTYSMDTPLDGEILPCPRFCAHKRIPP